MTNEAKPPYPSFTLDTAKQDIRAAEHAWNSRDPERVTLAYTVNSEWRNRSEFLKGRERTIALLRRKWAREPDYHVKESYGALPVIASRCALSMRATRTPASGIAPMAVKTGSSPTNDLTQRRYASINDSPIAGLEHKLRWERNT